MKAGFYRSSFSVRLFSTTQQREKYRGNRDKNLCFARVFLPFLRIVRYCMTQVLATKSMTIYYSEQNRPD